MEDSNVLEELFDSKIIRMLKVFLRDSSKEHYLQELARDSQVPVATCSRILHKLEKAGIVKVKTISRFRIYTWEQNKKTALLAKLFKEDVQIMKIFVEKVKGVPGIHMIILHGKESKDRANLLLIGENIDPGHVKAVCAEIKEAHNFIISPLSLTPDQYDQMSQMGLYSGTKKILYEK